MAYGDVEQPSQIQIGGGKLHQLVRALLRPSKLEKVSVKAKKDQTKMKIKSSQGFAGLIGKQQAAPEGAATPGEGPPV